MVVKDLLVVIIPVVVARGLVVERAVDGPVQQGILREVAGRITLLEVSRMGCL